MIVKICERFIALIISFVLILGFIPEAHAEEQVEAPAQTEGISANIVVDSADDPLQSVATVTTGGNVASYVDIDSTFVPSGYATLSTGSGAYVTSPGNYYSYHTSRNGQTSNTYVPTPTNDLAWAKNSSSTGVTGSLSSTAVSDYKGCGENGALCAKVNSKVIKIQALADVNITFNFSSNLTISASDGQGNIMEGVYTLKTTSSAPTIAQIKAGTVRSNTVKTDLSKTVSATGSVSESIQAGQYLFVYFYGFFNNQSSADVDTTTYTYTAGVTNFEITPVAENYSLTVGNCDCAGNLIGGGKIAVNGTAVTIPSGGTVAALTDALGGTSVALSVTTVPSGYFHIGWKIDGQEIFQKNYDFALNANTTAYALYIPAVTVTMGSNGYSNASYSYKTPSGTTVNAADQYIARNSTATAYYKTLNEAFSANSVVVLLGNIVLNGDFTIPNGKTLSVQRSWDDPATADLQRLAESTAASIFAKATINGTVTVQGSLVASGVQGTNDGVNGRATGGVGQLIINGTVNVASGGKLCAYGMITGPGKVNVASGGTVYELMEIRDMRSVYVLPTVTGSNGAFPFNCFFLKTNEVTTTYVKGATLTACYCISISGIKSNGSVTAIGSSNALFNISSGSLTKSFSPASPYNNKTIFRAESGSDIQSGKFVITVSASGFSETIDTSNYDLPINYCYAIEIMNGGSLTLNYNTKLLPGALVDVKEGGTLNIASGKRLVLYRANDYGFKALTGYSAAAYPTAFTRLSGLSYASNTAANVGSAKLNVDGTMNVAGGLYVTNQLTGLTTYGNGYNYLTGTGTINITGTLSNGTIKEWTQSDNQNAASVTVAYVPIKGITNFDAAVDDGQTDYNSLTKTTWYGMINGNGVNVWTTARPVTLSYDANGGSGEMASSSGLSGTQFTVAANGFTAPTGSIFDGWNTKADGTGVAYAAGDQITLSADTTLYAQWKQNTFTVTWMNDDGTAVLETDTGVEAGAAPSYDGETPVKAADAQYTYTFAGWSDSIDGTVISTLPNVTGNVTYYAVFHKWGGPSWTWTGYTDATATFTCANDPNHTQTVAAETITYADTASPTCEDAGLRTFTAEVTFNGRTYTNSITEQTPALGHDWGEPVWEWADDLSWAKATFTCARDPEHVETITATEIVIDDSLSTYISYTATVELDGRSYSDTVQIGKKFTITFDANDGSGRTDTQEFIYNAESYVSLKAIMFTREGHNFEGWAETPDGQVLYGNGATVMFNHDVTLYAIWTIEKYTVTWKNYDDTVLQTSEVAYGETPAYTGETPAKPGDAQYTYTFTGWDPEIVAVTGEATYTAQFKATVNKYVIKFVNYDGTVLQTSEVAYGDTPAYNGETPAKPGDAQYTYTFTGWDPEIAAVTGEATYTAQFEATVNKYNIKFVNYDGTVLQQGMVAYGETPAYTGETPAKPGDAQYTYTFTGWDPEIAAVTGEATYTAQFEETVNKYVIKFVNYDGTVLQTSEVAYGETPAYNGETPAKPGDAQYTYTFTGWDPEIAAVTGEATYTAQFESTVNKYNIKFVNYDGTVLQTSEVAYGDTPAYNGETPAKPAEGTTTYNFIGWDPEIAPVNGEATYTAQFEAVEPTGYHIYVTDYTADTAVTSLVADQLYNGEVTFTVSYTDDIACIVAIDNGDGTYTPIRCTTENGEHKFTVTVNADVNLVIVVRGDFNLDGTVDAIDATAILKYDADTMTKPFINKNLQIMAGDANGDGELDVVDANRILKYDADLAVINW